MNGETEVARPTLYDRVGGEPALIAAADLFYSKVMSDDLIRPFFQGITVSAQARKLVGFMTWAFGGSGAYKGRNLDTAHARLVRDMGLTDVHFDAVKRHLQDTLGELDLPSEVIEEATGIVETTRAVVLGRSQSD
jgi:hemoglobin